MKTSKKTPKNLPMFCDFSCKYASFGKKDVSGDCHREQAVYCELLRRYNNKNNRCLAAK